MKKEIKIKRKSLRRLARYIYKNYENACRYIEIPLPRESGIYTMVMPDTIITVADGGEEIEKTFMEGGEFSFRDKIYVVKHVCALLRKYERIKVDMLIG